MQSVCHDCGKPKKDTRSLRCRSCAAKYKWATNPPYTPKPNICCDCNQPKKSKSSKRCDSCARKRRLGKPTKTKPIVLDDAKVTFERNRLSKRDVIRMALEMSGLAQDMCSFPFYHEEFVALRKYVALRSARYCTMLSLELAHETKDATQTKAY